MQISLKHGVVNVLRSVLGNGSYALNEPRFGKNESRYVQEYIESTLVSSVGQFVDCFEASLVEYTGFRYAVAVVNGTCALQVALQGSGATMFGHRAKDPRRFGVAEFNEQHRTVSLIEKPGSPQSELQNR